MNHRTWIYYDIRRSNSVRSLSFEHKKCQGRDRYGIKKSKILQRNSLRRVVKCWVIWRCTEETQRYVIDVKERRGCAVEENEESWRGLREGMTVARNCWKCVWGSLWRSFLSITCHSYVYIEVAVSRDWETEAGVERRRRFAFRKIERGGGSEGPHCAFQRAIDMSAILSNKH